MVDHIGDVERLRKGSPKPTIKLNNAMDAKKLMSLVVKLTTDDDYLDEFISRVLDSTGVDIVLEDSFASYEECIVNCTVLNEATENQRVEVLYNESLYGDEDGALYTTQERIIEETKERLREVLLIDFKEALRST